MYLRVSQYMDKGTREQQEDAIRHSSERAFAKHGFMAVLSDGMGGLEDGEKFSEIATRKMIGTFESTPPSGDICQELIQCYEEAQKEALASQPEDDEDWGGATVVSFIFRDGKFAFLSVGDSRIYLLRGGGLIQLNREQTLGVRLDERAAMGDLTWDQARESARRKALIAHLGRESKVEPDVSCGPQMLIPGDRIILMSDGVFGTLSDEEILPLVSGDMADCAEKVIKGVLRKKRARQDNCSVFVFSLSKEKNGR